MLNPSSVSALERYLVHEVAKHGSHNQKTHGRRGKGTGGGRASGGKVGGASATTVRTELPGGHQGSISWNPNKPTRDLEDLVATVNPFEGVHLGGGRINVTRGGKKVGTAGYEVFRPPTSRELGSEGFGNHMIFNEMPKMNGKLTRHVQIQGSKVNRRGRRSGADAALDAAITKVSRDFGAPLTSSFNRRPLPAGTRQAAVNP